MVSSELTRRQLFLALPAGAAVAAFPGFARALDVNEARALIDVALGEVNAVINSGKPETEMYSAFENIFLRYADYRYIAQSALGPAGRSASAAEMDAYVTAFTGYISRKYGRRFREFIGTTIKVTGAEPLKSFFVVTSMADMRGYEPFQVDWHVFNKSGQNRFFNIIIEGINMLAAERTEVGALLDRRNGNIAALTQDLRTAI